MQIRLPLLGAVLAALISAFAAPALAQSPYLLFESGPVRPVALSLDGSRLYVVNTPAGTKPGGAVRLDAKAAAEAGDRGILFSAAAPKSLATRDFETNARNIAAGLGLTLASPVEAPAAPLDRLLGGRLGLRGRTQ